MQPVREALPYSYQSWIVVYILQDSTGKINIFLPDLTIFLPPPAPCICLQQGEFRAPECGSLLAAVTCRLFSSMPPAAPFLPAAEEMGERTPPKTNGFGIPFVRLQLRCKKVPQRIASAPTLAAADMARREQWSPSRLGDYQIAHLPPAAASMGAARWAAETIKFRTSA